MKFNGKNIQIHEGVSLGENVKIGDNTVVYPNVKIGKNSIIANDCVLGEPLNDYYYNSEYTNPETIIGENSLIRSHTILYAGSTFGYNFQTGHQVSIREFSQIGNNVSVGTKSDIQGYCQIGNYCRFHSYVNIGQESKIHDFVFIYPYAILTNDPLPPSDKLLGVEVGRFSQISSHAVIIGGVKIGEHCLIGANTTVNKDIPDNSLVVVEGLRIIPNLSRMPFFSNDGRRKYPWPFTFERGMPWKNIGFIKWLNEND